jgi:hypothetical protein
MNPLIVLALWFSFGPSGAAAPMAHQMPHQALGDQNVVRICSLAAGSCQELDGRLLEPARLPVSAGQLAVVDPETQSLVEPTAAQVEEISISIEESMDKSLEVKVERLSNGMLKAESASGFLVFEKATVQPKKEKP